MSDLACSFTGHREIAKEDIPPIKKRTGEIIDLLIARGVKEFITGGAIGFDLLCAELILEAKKYAEVTLTLAIPCKNQEKYYSRENKEIYKKVLEGADKVLTLSEFYHRGCMHTRNRFMVDNSDFLVSYCIKTEGGSYYTRCYALEKKKHIIDILI